MAEVIYLRPGVHETISHWLRRRLGFHPPAHQSLGRVVAPPKSVDLEDERGERRSSGDTSFAPEYLAVRLRHTPDRPAESIRSITVVGAPHPVTELLFQHISELFCEIIEEDPSVVINLAKSIEAVDAPPVDTLIYLRSESAGALRIAAALEAPGNARILQAATLITRLDDRYHGHPTVSVEAAMSHAPYLALRLAELTGIGFGSGVEQRGQALFAERAPYVKMFCDPMGYLAAMKVEDAGPAPERDARRPVALASTKTPTRLARALQGIETKAVLVVASDADAVRRHVDPGDAVALSAEIRSVGSALEAVRTGASAYRLACLFDVADEPDTPQLIDALEGAGLMACGVEPSVEQMRRLCRRCVDFGIGHNLSFAFEAAEWMACPRIMFEG